MLALSAISITAWSARFAASVSFATLCLRAAAKPVTVCIYSSAESPAVLYAFAAFSRAMFCASMSWVYSSLTSESDFPTLAAYSSADLPPAPKRVSIPPIDCSRLAPSSRVFLSAAPIPAAARAPLIAPTSPEAMEEPALLPALSASPPSSFVMEFFIPFAEGIICI